jgi:hypothetical protein
MACAFFASIEFSQAEVANKTTNSTIFLLYVAASFVAVIRDAADCTGMLFIYFELMTTEFHP